MAEGLTWNVYDANTMTQADIYGEVLCKLGETNERIVGLSADLAKSTKIGAFAAKYPERFFNAGIAEQNMFGMAAGLALSGLTPFVSTMAAFTTMRAAEQVRTDICYQNLDVKIIATHGGISFGQAGTTHHCTEDIAIMRSMANMTVIVPADGIECANAVVACLERPGPVYIRIGRGFEQACYSSDDYGFTIGKAVEITPGERHHPHRGFGGRLSRSAQCGPRRIWRGASPARSPSPRSPTARGPIRSTTSTEPRPRA